MGVRRKKTGPLDQTKLSTETAAAMRAREEALFQKELIKVLRTTAGKIPRLEKVF
jgi:hypothetical protein